MPEQWVIYMARWHFEIAATSSIWLAGSRVQEDGWRMM